MAEPLYFFGGREKETHNPSDYSFFPFPQSPIPFNMVSIVINNIVKNILIFTIANPSISFYN